MLGAVPVGSRLGSSQGFHAGCGYREGRTAVEDSGRPSGIVGFSRGSRGNRDLGASPDVREKSRQIVALTRTEMQGLDKGEGEAQRLF